MSKVDRLNEKIYDINLVTASDYAVSCRIKKQVYQNFLDSLPGKSENPVIDFQKAISKALKDRIDEIEKEREDKASNEVFDIQFAFKIGKVFTLLKQRADALKCGKFDDVFKKEKALTEWKNDKFEKCQVPVQAFVILDTEYTKNLIDEQKVSFFGDTLHFKRAFEPSDIIWESFDVEKVERRVRLVLVLSLMGAILFGTLYLMMQLF